MAVKQVIVQELPTVEWIWEQLQRKEFSLTLKNVNRKDKISMVFPENFTERFASRSPSYLSWFLYRDSRSNPLCRQLYAFFDKEPVSVLNEMAEKCHDLVYKTSRKVLPLDLLLEILAEFSKKTPSVFSQHMECYQFLEDLCYRSPARALALYFLLSAVNVNIQEICGRAKLYWQSVPEKYEPLAEDLYRLSLAKLRNGQKKEAHTVLLDVSKRQKADQALLGEVFLLMGNQYRFGEGAETDAKKAKESYWEAIRHGNYKACFSLYEFLQGGSLTEAYELLLLGAEHGQKNCQYELGKAYYYGSPLVNGRKDFVKAERYLQAAAEDGVKWEIRGKSEGDLSEKMGEDLTGKGGFEAAAFDASASETGDFSRVRGHGPSRYLLSRILFQKKTPEDQELARFYLTTAAKSGVEDARKDLLHLYGQESRITQTFAVPETGNVFGAAEADGKGSVSEETAAESPKVSEDAQVVLTNSLSVPTLHLLSTLPDQRAEIMICGQGDGQSVPEIPGERFVRRDERNVSAFCKELLERDRLPRMTVLLLDDADMTNLTDAKSLLLSIQKYLETEGGHPQAEIVEKIRICLKAEGKGCSALVESLLNQVAPFYVPLQVWDSGRNAAEALLDHYPLFLPLISGSKTGRVSVTAVGSGPSILWFLKDALSLTGGPNLLTRINSVSESQSLEKLFYAECPAYAEASDDARWAKPEFLQVDEKLEILLPKELSSRKEDDHPENGRENSKSGQKEDKTAVKAEKAEKGAVDEEVEKALQAIFEADYVVIDTGDDLRNLTLGMQLREEMLRRDCAFTSFPFLAVYCRDPEIASYAETITAGSEKFGFEWYNNYNLTVFGPGSRLGDWNHMMENRLEKRAQALHLRYYGIRERASENQALAAEAMQFYFERQYNQDSSRMAALFAIYALAEQGIFWPAPEMYDLISDQSALAEKYTALLEKQGFESAFEREHDRWVRYMMTRGWRRASQQQTLAYIEQGNPRAQFYLAKLHPLMCSWEELGDREPKLKGMQAFYEYIMPRIRPGKEVPVLKEYDRSNVEAIPDLLRI